MQKLRAVQLLRFTQAVRSYSLLYFTASQMYVIDQRKIYATVEIHL